MKYENIVRCQFSARKAQEMHFHQDIEIIYVLEGTLELGFEDGKQLLNTDDFYMVNSNVRHEYQSDSRVLLGSLFINYTMLTEIFGGEQIFFLCNSARERSESYEKMRYYIRQIFNYYQTTEGQGIVLKNSIYYQLLYLITSLQLFGKIKIQTRVLYCIIKAVNKNYTKRDEFVSTAYYT